MQIHSRRHAAPRRHPLTLALWAAALCLPATFTVAQETSTPTPEPEAKKLDTIVVTAQKREQQIQEVPIAISAYSGDFLQKNGMDNYQSLGTLVPGLEIQFQSVANPSLSIRGITADLNDPTQEPRISVFQDGVSMSRSRGSFAVPFDLQRIEVLRGPQGTLFGRAAEIGALHFIQNKARPGNSGGFQLGFGEFAESKFTGFLNTSMSDNMFGRIAVFYDKRDGYVDNLSGGTLQGFDTKAIRGSLHFNIGDSNGLDFIFNHEEDTPPGTAFRSMIIPNRNASAEDIAAVNAWLKSPTPTEGLPGASTGIDPYEADAQRGDALGSDRTLDSATLLGRFRINDSWSLHTTTGWRDFDSLEKFDSDGSQVDLIEFDEKAKGRQFSQEFRFNYDNGGKFTSFVGLDYTSETSVRDLDFQTDERSLYALLSVQAHQLLPLLPIVSVLNPDGTPNVSRTKILGNLFLNPDHRETFGNDVDVRSTELFADGTWQLADKWELTVGLRGTHESATYGYHADEGNASVLGRAFSGRTDPVTGAFLAACPTAGLDPTLPCNNLLFPTTNGRLTSSGSWNSAVGRAVLRYKFNDDVSSYASISRGRRPAMLQVSDINPTSPTGVKDLPAEIVTSYEVGLKGTTGSQRLAYDLAAYYYDYSNFQAQVFTNGPIAVDVNGGRAHATGIEASLYARLSDHTTGFLNIGLSEGGFNGVDDQGRPQALAGNTFRMFPKQKLSLGLDWTHPLSGNREFFLRPNATYQSTVYFEDDNNPSSLGHSFAGQIQQSSYGLVNLRGGVNFGRTWAVTVSLDNVFDKKYLIDAGNTGLTFGIPTVIPGQPRTLGVSLNGKF